MKKIFLIRHGQASFGQDHYDQLSADGERQASLLASSWAKQKFQPDSWLSGELTRQKQTLNIVQAELEVSANPKEYHYFNEFPAEAITRHYLPTIVASKNDPSLTREKIFSNNLLFQKLFAEVVKSWITKTSAAELEFESWNDYSQRVTNGIKQLKQESFDQSLAVFTSAGFIAACCYQLMTNKQELDMQMFKLAWNVINSSVTELHLNNGNLYLHSFNQYAHLNATPELITYR